MVHELFSPIFRFPHKYFNSWKADSVHFLAFWMNCCIDVLYFASIGWDVVKTESDFNWDSFAILAMFGSIDALYASIGWVVLKTAAALLTKNWWMVKRQQHKPWWENAVSIETQISFQSFPITNETSQLSSAQVCSDVNSMKNWIRTFFPAR